MGIMNISMYLGTWQLQRMNRNKKGLLKILTAQLTPHAAQASVVCDFGV